MLDNKFSASSMPKNTWGLKCTSSYLSVERPRSYHHCTSSFAFMADAGVRPEPVFPTDDWTLPEASLSRSASTGDVQLPEVLPGSSNEFIRPSQPPPVRQALIPAAARITTPDSFSNPRQLIRMDGAPVIIHLLRGLQAAGISRTVITLGHAAHLLAEEVRKHSFGTMLVDFVWCEASSWKRGHASNILAARSMFRNVRKRPAPPRPDLVIQIALIRSSTCVRSPSRVSRSCW